jgi:hypothetical protein
MPSSCLGERVEADEVMSEFVRQRLIRCFHWYVPTSCFGESVEAEVFLEFVRQRL